MKHNWKIFGSGNITELFPYFIKKICGLCYDFTYLVQTVLIMATTAPVHLYIQRHTICSGGSDSGKILSYDLNQLTIINISH